MKKKSRRVILWPDTHYGFIGKKFHVPRNAEIVICFGGDGIPRSLKKGGKKNAKKNLAKEETSTT